MGQFQQCAWFLSRSRSLQAGNFALPQPVLHTPRRSAPHYLCSMRPHLLSHRLTSFALALLVLAASVGLPVQRRTCRLSGRSTTRIGWGQALPGAPGRPVKGHQASLERSCYAYNFQLHQLRTDASAPDAAKLLPAAPGPWALPPAKQPAWGPAVPGVATLAPTRWTTGLAPPPRAGGRALLRRIGVLVV